MNESLHTVRRAVILAAGTGTRLRPLTEQTPKPLISVNGVRMIDSILRALHANGVTEIYAVVGHLKEQFRSLPKQYPGLVLIENPDYATSNNIGSLYAAREHLMDCIILDGDLIIRNPAVLAPTFTRSGYHAVWCAGETNEWLLTEKDGIITGCSRTGGKGGWQLFSVSRWTEQDGKKLAALVEQAYKAGRRDLYWDDVPLFLHPEAFTLAVYPMQQGDVIEIDSREDLERIDPSYGEEGTDRGI